MKARVLVVDDSPTVRATIEWLLVGNNYDVQVAQDGLVALAELEAFSPDVVLLDIYMPHLNGVQLCQIMRQKSQFAALPILVFSGLTGKDDIERAIRAGANAYLFKPIQDNTLLTSIESLLNYDQRPVGVHCA